MTRAELIEIIYQYKKESQILGDENAKLSRELDDRRIRIDTAGSIAQAALSLNRVFEVAQAAADQYLNSVKDMYPQKNQTSGRELSFAEESVIGEELRDDSDKELDKKVKAPAESGKLIIKRAKKKAKELERQARLRCDELISKGAKEYREMIKKAEAECRRMKQLTVEAMLNDDEVARLINKRNVSSNAKKHADSHKD